MLATCKVHPCHLILCSTVCTFYTTGTSGSDFPAGQLFLCTGKEKCDMGWRDLGERKVGLTVKSFPKTCSVPSLQKICGSLQVIISAIAFMCLEPRACTLRPALQKQPVLAAVESHALNKWSAVIMASIPYKLSASKTGPAGNFGFILPMPMFPSATMSCSQWYIPTSMECEKVGFNWHCSFCDQYWWSLK